MAGRVEPVGKSITRLQPGDEVFTSCTSTLAEFAGAITALQGLRDVGKQQPGQKALINGGSGGVGMFAVQIAIVLGAEVTGVCSSRNVEMVRSIGADHVIDYTKENFT